MGDVGFWGLAASLVLVAVAVVLSWTQHLGVEWRILWAAVRVMVQLLIVGVALVFVLDDDTPLIWSWVWVVLLIGFAALTVKRRAPEAPGIGWIALVAFSVSAVVTLGVIFGLGIFPLEARTLVPLAGMMVGNAMTATVLVSRRVVGELGDQRDRVEVRLALGQSSRDAARPYVAKAVRTALIPQIETTKAVGIVFLPGAMTGLILAGVDPLDAVLVQIVIMYLVLASVAVTTSVVGIGMVRTLFSRDDQRLILPAASAID
jgi:putative ABC transport system permease protein